MALEQPARDPSARPRPSNWASSSGTETVVPWVVTVDLRPAEGDAALRGEAPPQPRVTTAEDEDWMTGCYYF